MYPEYDCLDFVEFPSKTITDPTSAKMFCEHLQDERKKVPFHIHRPRQVVGLIYVLIYLLLFFAYAFILSDDQSWAINLKFTAAVMLWFLLSLAVKMSMFMNRSIELLNLAALVAVMLIGFAYYPHPGPFSSIEKFCYYLNFIGGSACDFFDFLYEGAAKRTEDTL